jgi:hypothetical protein
MNKVMADQSAAMGIPIVVISSIEHGSLHVTDDYISKFVAWMELASLDAHRLKNLSSLPRGRQKRETGQSFSADDILGLLSIEEKRAPTADDKGTSSEIS